MRELEQANDLLKELFPNKDDMDKFLDSPQRELGKRTPREVMLEDHPSGLRNVVQLLGRMAEGIPT